MSNVYVISGRTKTLSNHWNCHCESLCVCVRTTLGERRGVFASVGANVGVTGDSGTFHTVTEGQGEIKPYRRGHVCCVCTSVEWGERLIKTERFSYQTWKKQNKKNGETCEAFRDSECFFFPSEKGKALVVLEGKRLENVQCPVLVEQSWERTKLVLSGRWTP